MITVKAFLAAIREIENIHPTYRIGGVGRDGTCDCVGLVMDAATRAGEKWRWLHSSNECRSYMRTMHPLTSADELRPGMLVHKSRPPGAAGYSLPERYTGSDRLDYYHVGVVIQTKPLIIAHCTSWSGGSGIKYDNRIRGWQWYGDCQLIEPTVQPDEPTGETDMKYKVTAKKGSTVNIRTKPKGEVWGKLPVGTIVESDGDGSGEWLAVRVVGYMKTEFLEEVG